MKEEERYVGAAALSLVLGVSVQTLYKWVKEGFIEDRREERGHGLRHFFNLEQVVRGTALAPPSKARSWTKKKYLEDHEAFDAALTKYITLRSRVKTRKGKVAKSSSVHLITDSWGYFEGWDLSALYDAAVKNWKSALRVQEQYFSVNAPQEKFDTHANA